MKIVLTSIPAIQRGDEKFYSTSSVMEYAELFSDYFGKSVVDGVRQYLMNIVTSSVITEDEINSAFEYSSTLEKMKKAREERLEQNRLREKEQILANAQNFVAVYINDFDATFLLPIDYSTLSEALIEAIDTRRPVPKIVLQDLMKLPDVESKFTLWGGAKEFIETGFKLHPETKMVVLSRPTEDILEFAENYIKKINEIQVD